MENDEVTYEMRQAYMEYLLDDIKVISDPIFQKNVWIKAINPNIVDSWEERMCMFFDDRNIDRFLKDEEDGPTAFEFTQTQTEELVKLRNMIRVFSHRKYAECDPPESYSDPQEIINDPEWHRCVEQAKITYKAFEGYEVPKEPIKKNCSE